MTRFPYQYPLREEEAPKRSRFDWLILILLLLMAAAIIYLAPRTISTPAASDLTAGEVIISENPEILVFRNYQAAAEQIAALEFARQNPEVLTAQRYLQQLEASRQKAFLVENPEVRHFQSYQAEQR